MQPPPNQGEQSGSRGTQAPHNESDPPARQPTPSAASTYPDATYGQFSPTPYTQNQNLPPYYRGLPPPPGMNPSSPFNRYGFQGSAPYPYEPNLASGSGSRLRDSVPDLRYEGGAISPHGSTRLPALTGSNYNERPYATYFPPPSSSGQDPWPPPISVDRSGRDAPRRSTDRDSHTGPDTLSQGDAENIRPDSADLRLRSSSTSEGIDRAARMNAELTDEILELDESEPDHRKRKRNRTIRSCVPCHNHKRKCDRKRPCGRCTALGLTGTCVYEIDEARDHDDPDVAESDRLRRRIAELEQVVRELRQRQPQRGSSHPVSSTGNEIGMDLKKRRVIIDRFARFKIDEVAMAAVASALEGKESGLDSRRSSLSSSELNNDKHPPDEGQGQKDYLREPYRTYVLPGEELAYDSVGRKTFIGASAGKSMIRRLRELASTASMSDTEDLLSVPEDTAFTGVFPDSHKTFPFTTIWSQENFNVEVIGLLPSKEQSDLLLQSFKEEVCPLFLAWDVPTLETEFRRFFSMSMVDKMNIPLCLLGLYLMISSLGCVTRASKAEIYGHSEAGKQGNAAGVYFKEPRDLTSSRLQSELYLSGAYQCLRLCSFMSNPNLNTIQTQILINIYLLNSERSADSWAQTGSLVRQCVAMGLHVDPVSLDQKISMRDAEVRRRIWWTVAGLDATLCVSFGRPSAINFYKTMLPQDRTDDNLSGAPGSAQSILPPSNVLRNETTDITYHTAFFQLTIPSYELLDRIFHVDRKYSRSAIYGWFAPAPESLIEASSKAAAGSTYNDVVRLARDIFEWYSHLSRGMRFDPDEDSAEGLLRTRSTLHINQTLALCVSAYSLVMILHRPYLRVDPSAYPESSEICSKASHTILKACRVGSDAKASIFWSWWTMSFRAFHAGTVCAFFAIRQPGTELALQCLDDLRGAVQVFRHRIPNWSASHPAQADLYSGLMELEKLATAATQQKESPRSSNSGAARQDPGHLSLQWTPTSDSEDFIHHPGTPLSHIRGFPDMPVSSPNGPGSRPNEQQGSKMTLSTHFHANEGGGFAGDGFHGPEALALPQYWASMFGIKLEEEARPS